MFNRLSAAVLWAVISFLAVPIVQAEPFFVRFHDGTDKSANEQLLEDLAIRVVRRFQLTDAVLCERIDKGAAPLQALAAEPRVMYTAPNMSYECVGIPDDPSFAPQWALQNTGQKGGTVGADISAVEAWNLVDGAGDVIVAIIDTGIEYTHSDLAPRMWDGGPGIPHHGWDFGEGDNDPMPDEGHGTHVAGSVGAVIGNGIGIAGVASNARLMALKCSKDGASEFKSDALIAAMDFAAAHGARVINASYGRLGSSHAPTLEAVQRLDNAGVVLVAAAGNDGVDLNGSDQVFFYPACYDVPNVVSVAATDRYDRLVGFSNWGQQQVDLAAPGAEILSTFLDGGYRFDSGTSMAAPHVTGAAAILIGLYPELAPAEVRAILMAGTVPLPGLSRKVASGGRLDLMAMLTAADRVAPGAISNLSIVGIGSGGLRAHWTAVGDDGYTGAVRVNDLRYSMAPITGPAEFEAAVRVNQASEPLEAGMAEMLPVTGLEPLTTYHFALRAGDRAGNWSPLAFASGTTDGLPAAILDESPLDFSLRTGESLVSELQIANVGPGRLNYLARAVSVGLSKSARRDDQRVGPTDRQGEPGAQPRASGAGRRGPAGASGFEALASRGAAKAADWGTLFHDDFETDPGFWSPGGIADPDLWRYSTAAYNSPGRSLACVDPLSGDYDTGAALDVSMVGGTIDLSRAEGDVTLEFFEWYGTELGYDFCDVEVSGDGGLGWTPLRTGVSGDSDGWRLTSVDLSGYAGQQVNLRFRLRTGDALHNDYPGWWVDDVSVRDGGASWVRLLYGAGLVPAGKSRVIYVQAVAEGLCAGLYSAELQISTDDPVHPTFFVPLQLDVTSAADLHVEAIVLGMGMAHVGFAATRTFHLTNIGCLPLTITAPSSSSAEFAVNLSDATVQPGMAAALTVEFSPSAVGGTGGVITFATNDPGQPLVRLVAYGFGLLPPQLALPESSFTQAVLGEAESHRSFEIRNTGAGVLDWRFVNDLNADGLPAEPGRILFDLDINGNHALIAERLAATGYRTTSLVELDPETMTFSRRMLDDADVVVIYGYRALTPGEVDLLVEFVENGGGLLFDVFNWNPAFDYAALLAHFGASRVDESIPTEDFTPLVEHALTDGVEVVRAVHDSYLDATIAPLEPFLRSGAGLVTQAFGLIGSGRVFLSTGSFSHGPAVYLGDNLALVDNVYAWLAADAVSMVPGDGSLAPGGVQVVDVVFDSGSAIEGVRDYLFHIASNDPANAVATVEATYDVDGTGRIQLPSGEIALGLVYAAADTSTYIELYNAGNGPVFIQAIGSSDARFSVKPTSMLLTPKQRKPLQVRLHAGPEGPVATEIAMASDAPGQDDLRFFVDAEPRLPHAVLSTVAIDTVELFTGGIAARTFELHNAGLWPLDYAFAPGAVPAHISIVGTGTLGANASRSITVGFMAKTVCGVGTLGTFSALTSNDIGPPLGVAATLTVVDAPHIALAYPSNMIYPQPKGQLVTITNAGCTDLTVLNAAIVGQYFSVTGFAPANLAPGDQTQFRVYFLPLESGEFEGDLTVTTNDPDQSEMTLTILGQRNSTENVANGLADSAGVVISASPNPFNPSTRIDCSVLQDGHAEIRIHDLRGHLVREFTLGVVRAGMGSVEWNGRDRRGNRVASGVYFYQLIVDGRRIGEIGSVTLVK